MAIEGRRLRIRVGTAVGGPFNNVGGLNSGSQSCSAGTQDVTAFGDDWVRRVVGLRDASYSLSGFWRPTDTTGQIVIRNAFIAGTSVWIQFLPDGTTGFAQEALVSSFEISTSVDGVSEVSIELEGNGAITTV
jgi:predicted secreted protein